jgi:NAD+ synthase (glutamine-hydrolysing)
MRKITIATCSLNQWALDFTGNLKRTKDSFRISKEKGATYRLGPELELCGYGCNDHLLEMDTMNHCFETLLDLMQSNECENIIGDVGMPVIHNGIRYNCRVIFYNQKILLIRPKMFLANDGNYREMRWFTPWTKNTVEQYKLPSFVRLAIYQESVSFGNCVLTTDHISFGTELCEELFTPSSPHINLSLSGIEVFTNGSASHHEFQKLQRRIELIREATLKCGGIYLYANQQGCDGERVYYDGSALIIVNGQVLAQSSQFSLNDVEVITATIDIEEVITFRASIISRGMQASKIDRVTESQLDVDLLDQTSRKLTKPIKIKLLNPNEEIQYGPACWLWDYLRRSKQNGFFLPLSGGIDSCSTALIVFSMCDLVYKKIVEEDVQVLNDLRAITKNKEFIPKSPQEICGY